jgi:hypothetical protein
MKVNNFLFNYSVQNIRLYSNIMASFCLLNIILLMPDIFELYGGNGLIDDVLNNKSINQYCPLLSWLINPLQRIGLTYNTALLSLITMYVISLIFVISNYMKFYFSIIAWFLHIMIVNSSYYFSYGADYFISFALFVNIFLCIPNSKNTVIINSFTIRFIQIQLCFVYFFSGFGKILGTDWFDGNAVWLVINSFSSRTTIQFFSLFTSFPILFVILGWLTVTIELLFPFLIYRKVTKKIALWGVIFMHFGIIFIMHFYTFGSIMIILNFVAWNNYINLDYPSKTINNKLHKTLKDEY